MNSALDAFVALARICASWGLAVDMLRNGRRVASIELHELSRRRDLALTLTTAGARLKGMRCWRPGWIGVSISVLGYTSALAQPDVVVDPWALGDDTSPATTSRSARNLQGSQVITDLWADVSNPSDIPTLHQPAAAPLGVELEQPWSPVGGSLDGPPADEQAVDEPVVDEPAVGQWLLDEVCDPWVALDSCAVSRGQTPTVGAAASTHVGKGPGWAAEVEGIVDPWASAEPVSEPPSVELIVNPWRPPLM
jgi:hypothetical protein